MTDTRTPEGYEARTPAEAYERWVGSQSVSEFLGDDTPEAAVDSYIREITASPHGGPVEQCGCEPTSCERDLLVEYVRLHAPVPPGDLIGHAEAAALLGWDNRKLAVYRGRGLLPAPVREFASGPVWRRQDILRYGVRQVVGEITALTNGSYDDVTAAVTNLRNTHHLTTDAPLGTQLVARKLLTEEQGNYLDSILPVFDSQGRVIDYDAAVNLMDDDLREELHASKLCPCSRQAFLTAYAEAHKAKFGEGFAPWLGEAW